MNEIDKEKVKEAIDYNIMEGLFAATIPMFKGTGTYTDTKDGPLIHIDNGSNVLAVAHLDTVQSSTRFARLRKASVSSGYDAKTKTKHYTIRDVVCSPKVDDRLGVFTIMWLLPKLGIVPDILLTDGEEKGLSTAKYYEPEDGKEYNWIFSFDRSGVDVVCYEYEDDAVEEMLEELGFTVGFGSFSDICFMEDLGIKGFNFGTGYYNNHAPSAWFDIDDYCSMVARFTKFWHKYKDVKMPHEKSTYGRYGRYRGSYYGGGWQSWASYDSYDKAGQASTYDGLPQYGTDAYWDMLYSGESDSFDYQICILCKKYIHVDKLHVTDWGQEICSSCMRAYGRFCIGCDTPFFKRPSYSKLNEHLCNWCNESIREEEDANHVID